MTDDQQPPHPKPTGLSAFWQELRRRHVVRVAITYAVVGWAIMQVAGLTFEGFDIPIWAFRFVMLMVILGFPLAIILAWAFELTPEGIRTTKTARVEHPESHKDESHAKKRHWFSLGVAAAVPTLIFGVLALFFFVRSGSLESELASTEQVELENDKSIAVLPLTNMSPDPENAFFADGVQEDVLTNLSKIQELLVIGRTSTIQYRETSKTLQQIGEELNVRYLVEGSVRRAGDQVLVTVQLIDSRTEGHLWAENYNRKLDDIFRIQADIAKAISRELHATISPEEIEQIEIRPTENQEAYDAYLLAGNREITSREEMGPLLEKAVDLDPQFYQARAELAEYLIQTWSGPRSRRQDADLYTKAHQALDEVKRLAPDSPELLVALSSFSYSEEDDIESAIDYAYEARLKGLSSSSTLGHLYMELGQLDEAQLYLEEFVRINPYPSTSLYPRLFHIYTLKEMWDEAEAFIERNLELLDGSDESGWKERASYLDFLRTAEKSAYKIRPKGSLSDASAQFINSIFSKNLKDSLGYLEEYSPSNVNLTAGGRWGPTLIGLGFAPVDLVTALIHFELGEKDTSLEIAKNVASHLEKSVNSSHKINPRYLAALTICYALENDLVKVKSIIPEIRKLTENVNWKFRAQVDCEMKIAIAYLVLGDDDKAIETLDAASKMDSPIFVNRELDLWFIFDRLRGDPRFDKLLEG